MLQIDSLDSFFLKMQLLSGMKYLLVLSTFLLCWKYHQTVPVLAELEASSQSKKLKELSKLGEDYLGQEIKKALLGMRQMKEIMEKNAEQHENIQKSLKKTQEEKEACEFLKEWSLPSSNTNTTEEKSMSGYNVADELSQANGIFSQLMSDVGIMFNQSIVFFTSVQKVIGNSFQKLFLSDVKQGDATTAGPDRDPVIISNHDEHWDFSSLFQSLYEFGQSVFEAMSDAVVKIYKTISNNTEDFSILPGEAPAHLKSTPSNIKCNELQNASECWLFQDKCQQCYESAMKDCPDVKELQLKSEVAFKLVNVSAEQYEDVVQLAQQHTDDTFHLVSQMKQKFGWVAGHANATSRTGTIFSIEKVSFSPDAEEQNVHDRVVEVRIFTSPNVEIKLPANISIESQEFIQYVTEKALEYHKNNF
ncbi:clusterin-like protein 1 isoform X2 [Hyperolius riggenbachi]|uniref:clusterin-like protein 1 isoform X2 n=1 Tax=Hyperolius riggenbachi TaxID=752182 RepID=UPI0035A3A24C